MSVPGQVPDLIERSDRNDDAYRAGSGRAGDRRIDQLVYEVYGLTDDEIRIIEGAVNA